MTTTSPEKVRIAALQDELAGVRAELEAARESSSELQSLLQDIAERRAREAALERSQARFLALTETVTAAVWMCDVDGEIVEPCPAWGAFTGQPFEAYRGRGWLEAVHPEDRQRAAQAWIGAVERQGAYEVVYRLRRHDGAYRLTQARGAPVRGDRGEVREWIGANFDITEQERANVELRDREERLRAALSGSGAGTFRWDILTNELDWDVELDRIFGLPPGETTRSLEGFIAQVHPDDRALVIAACERCASDGADFEETFRVIWPDGSVHWIFDRGRTYYDRAGRPAYMTGACLDITERQEATRRLRASEERLRVAQEAGEVGTFEWFPDSDEVVASEQYYRLWGLTPGAPITATEMTERLHPEDRSRSGLANVGRLDSALDYVEYRIRRADTGETRWLARRGQMLTPAEGGPPRMVGAVYDVTDQRLAEERLHEVLESVTDGFLGVDAGWRITLVNSAARRHLAPGDGEMVGRDLWTLLPDVVGSPIEAAMRQVMDERRPLTVEVASVRRPGRFVEMRIAPKARGGLAIGFTDVTARHRAERHRELLVNELNHRVKNTLAIVQATAHQTLKGGLVPRAVRDSFEGRLGALARAHDILTRRNWETAYLHELMATALAPFTQRLGDRVRADGPELRLPARTAVSFALAMHELATNAAKYGALSGDRGTVTVAWWLTRRGDDAWLQLRWTERDGPTVAPPGARGFGSRMIERALAAELGGEVRLVFEPAGVTCVINAPLRDFDQVRSDELDAWRERAPLALIDER